MLNFHIKKMIYRRNGISSESERNFANYNKPFKCYVYTIEIALFEFFFFFSLKRQFKIKLLCTARLISNHVSRVFAGVVFPDIPEKEDRGPCRGTKGSRTLSRPKSGDPRRTQKRGP